MQAQSIPTKHITNDKGAKRRFRLVLAFLLVVFVWAAVTAFDQAGRLRDRSKQLRSIEAQLQETQQVNVDAKKEIDRLNDPAYQQEMIRKQLQYAGQGETVFDAPQKHR